MKLSLFFYLVTKVSALISTENLLAVNPLVKSGDVHSTEWNLFMSAFSKRYSSQEDTNRRRVYSLTRLWIKSHNKKYETGLVTYKLGINQFTDMSLEEAKRTRTGLIYDPKEEKAKEPIQSHNQPKAKRKNKLKNKRLLSFLPFEATLRDANILLQNQTSLPDFINWKDHFDNWPPIKDQENCGSCWAYSAVGVLEFQLVKLGQKKLLSEQQLIDCSGAYGNKGCSGGLMTRAFEYIKAKGITTIDLYPNVKQEATCQENVTNILKVTGYEKMNGCSEKQLMETIANFGPVCVAMDASQSSMYAYEGGVYEENYCNSTKVTHGVIAAGYGTEDGVNYWLIKNSWGDSWGESGYMRILRDNNHCGILTLVSYPKFQIL